MEDITTQEQHKDIQKKLSRAYEVLDDVRAKLEDINDDIVINELHDEYHSDLSESIQDWLGQIYALDCNMEGLVKNDFEPLPKTIKIVDPHIFSIDE